MSGVAILVLLASDLSADYSPRCSIAGDSVYLVVCLSSDVLSFQIVLLSQ